MPLMENAPSLWNALLQQSPLVIMMGVAVYFLWQSDKAREQRSDRWIEMVLKDKDKEIAEIKVAAKECTTKHELTQQKLEKITIALVQSGYDPATLNASPVKRPGIMDT